LISALDAERNFQTDFLLLIFKDGSFVILLIFHDNKSLVIYCRKRNGKSIMAMWLVSIVIIANMMTAIQEVFGLKPTEYDTPFSTELSLLYTIEKCGIQSF